MGDFCDNNGIWPPYLWRFPEVEDPENSPSSLLVYFSLHWENQGWKRVPQLWGAPWNRGFRQHFGMSAMTFHPDGHLRLSQRIRSSPWKVVRTETPGFVPQWNEASICSMYHPFITEKMYQSISQSTWPSFHQWIGWMEKVTRKRHGFPHGIWGSNRPCSDSQPVALRLTSTRFSSYTPPIQAGCLCSPKFRLMESSIRAISILWKLSWGLENDKKTLFKKR